jgi:hypothetical protein
VRGRVARVGDNLGIGLNGYPIAICHRCVVKSSERSRKRDLFCIIDVTELQPKRGKHGGIG